MKGIINLLPHFFAILICSIFLTKCYAKLNDHKINWNYKTFLIILATTILTVLNNAYINFEIKTFTTLLIVSLNYKLIFNDSLKKTLVNYIIISSVLLLIEIIVTNGLSILDILNEQDAALPLSIIKFTLSILIGVLEYLIVCIPLVKRVLSNLIKFFVNYVNEFNVAYLLFFTIAVLGILNITNSSNNFSKLIFCLIIIFAILFVIIIRSKTQEESLRESNKRLVDYNDNYGKFLDEYKIYKHNIKNKLISLKTYGNKKVNALIDDLLEEETSFSVKNNKLYNIPNGIKGIVAEKLYNTNFNVLIDNKIKGDPFNNLSPKTFNNISECLGIVLDNAIEASKETDDPIITMDLYENNKSIVIKVGNNFHNGIDLDKLGEKYYSTKNRGSGLGLFSIKQNKIVSEKIDIINNFYYIELQIKKAR